jgi:hypothetical protein
LDAGLHLCFVDGAKVLKWITRQPSELLAMMTKVRSGMMMAHLLHFVLWVGKSNDAPFY